MSEHDHWQLKIFQKTLKKKEKLQVISRLLPQLQGQRVLDLGCAKGTLSYFLQRVGGNWVFADLDLVNVSAASQLVGQSCVCVDPAGLSFANECFDGIVSLDLIEHVRDDTNLMKEIARILKPGGWLVLSTPITGRWFVLNQVKKWVGLPPSAYGHVVEGYSLDSLSGMLRNAGFEVLHRQTYSKFFTELIELLINVVFVKALGKRSDAVQTRDGHISPGSAADLKKHARAFRFYSVIYPISWLIARLDRLLVLHSGYATLIKARKR